MLKLGAICSSALLVIGTVLLLTLGSGSQVELAALIFLCLLIFGFFWAVHAARRASILKLGVICSFALLVVGGAVLAILSYAGRIPDTAVGYAAQSLGSACLMVFAVFWVIHSVKKSLSKKGGGSA